MHFIIKKRKLLCKKNSFFSFNKILKWKFIILIIFLFFNISLFSTNKSFNIKIYGFKWENFEVKKGINYTREEALTRGRKFLDTCLKEKLIISLIMAII